VSALSYFVITGGVAMLLTSAGVLIHDARFATEQKRGEVPPSVAQLNRLRWRDSLALVLLSWGPLLLIASVLAILVRAGAQR